MKRNDTVILKDGNRATVLGEVVKGVWWVQGFSGEVMMQEESMTVQELNDIGYGTYGFFVTHEIEVKK